jgi:hypothetical protein
MKKLSRIIAGAMILLGSYVIIVAKDYPPTSNGVLGPGFFPILLGILLIALSSLAILVSFVSKEEETIVFGEGTQRVLITSAIVLGYLAGVAILGFLLSTPLFLIIIMRYFQVPKWSTVLLVSFTTTAILYVVFLKFLSVSLPSGILF